MLDLVSLQKATDSLERAVRRAELDTSDLELRDAAIQRFEYTYELAYKMIKRRIEMDSPSPAAIDALGFRDLIRHGAERGILAAPEAWYEYREHRNITAHTYNEDKAKAVYRTAVRFLGEARALLAELQRRNLSG